MEFLMELLTVTIGIAIGVSAGRALLAFFLNTVFGRRFAIGDRRR